MGSVRFKFGLDLWADGGDLWPHFEANAKKLLPESPLLTAYYGEN